MANSEIRSSRLQAAVEVKYTVFHPLVVEVLCVMFLHYARWLGQKQNTRNFYHKRMKDGVRSRILIHQAVTASQDLKCTVARPKSQLMHK